MIDMKRKWMKIIVALCMTFCLCSLDADKTAGNAQDAKMALHRSSALCGMKMVPWSQEAQEADFLLRDEQKSGIYDYQLPCCRDLVCLLLDSGEWPTLTDGKNEITVKAYVDVYFERDDFVQANVVAFNET